jgi:hypothetical protein
LWQSFRAAMAASYSARSSGFLYAAFTAATIRRKLAAYCHVARTQRPERRLANIRLRAERMARRHHRAGRCETLRRGLWCKD